MKQVDALLLKNLSDFISPKNSPVFPDLDDCVGPNFVLVVEDFLPHWNTNYAPSK